MSEKKRTCLDCKFWDGEPTHTDTHVNWARCKAKPPTIEPQYEQRQVGDVSRTMLLTDHTGVWPLVRHNETACGAFREKPRMDTAEMARLEALDA